MTVTEVIRPFWRSDAHTKASLEERRHLIPEMFNAFEGVNHAYLGQIIEENGLPVDDYTREDIYLVGESRSGLKNRWTLLMCTPRLG